jgi:hypothetical protein
MGVAYERRLTVLAAGAVLLSLSLGGCATSGAGSSPMDARAEAPATPNTSAYAPLADPPPAREDRATMTSDERTKLKKELLAIRDRQLAVAKAQGATAPVESVKP